MEEEIIRRLVDLNAAFYDQLAVPFSDSRSGPQPGYYRLLEHLPQGALSLLDVGCGNGRFGRFLRASGVRMRYVGVDFSPRLMETGEDADALYYQRDLSCPDALTGLGSFDLISCLSTLQHIPGLANRIRLVMEMGACLQPGGRIILTNWQFLDNPRQRRKVRYWSEIGLSEKQVEANDYLLTWDRGGVGLRYVALIDQGATGILAEQAALHIIDQFRSDGREGDLNLYTILERSN